MKVKICGMTNLADARYAAALGIDFLGFIQDPDSRRYVEPQIAAEIIEWVSGPETVGVFVNRDASFINSVIDAVGFDWVQLHGEESVETCAAIDRPVIKAFRIRPGDTARSMRDRMDPYGEHVRYFLLDAFDTHLHGGTGKAVDRGIAADLAQSFPVLLAGGLRPENVVESIRSVNPDGVDVSSGLESQVGKKDFALMDAFVTALADEGVRGGSQ